MRCTHPGMPTVLGDENVKESWRIVFESMGGAGGKWEREFDVATEDGREV